MARAVFTAPPVTVQRPGVLPFLYAATVTDAQGQLLAEGVPCMVWPASATGPGRAGRNHTHTGEAHAAFAGVLTGPNVRLAIATGDMAGEYTVVTAIEQPFVPHVQLELSARAA